MIMKYDADMIHVTQQKLADEEEEKICQDLCSNHKYVNCYYVHDIDENISHITIPVILTV